MSLPSPFNAALKSAPCQKIVPVVDRYSAKDKGFHGFETGDVRAHLSQKIARSVGPRNSKTATCCPDIDLSQLVFTATVGGFKPQVQEIDV